LVNQIIQLQLKHALMSDHQSLGKPDIDVVVGLETERNQNYPWNLNLSPLVGAIAAGCPVILKVGDACPGLSEVAKAEDKTLIISPLS
jgi:hypothetical protein